MSAWLPWALGLAVCMVVVGVASAQSGCFAARATVGGQTVTEGTWQAAALEAAKILMAGNPTNSNPSVTCGKSGRPTANNESTSCTVGFDTVCCGGHFSTTITVAATPLAECPDPEACQCASGNAPASMGCGEKFTDTVAPSGGSYCNPVSQCKMSVSSSMSAGGASVYQIEHTNQQCGLFDPPPPGSVPPGDSCVTTAGGNELCMSKSGDNCGYFNDDFICFPRVEDDGCAALGDGSRMCGPDAPTPPVPDNGTPGEPADPDERVTTTNNTYNYYNHTTVDASGRDPGSGDNPFEEGDDGSGVNTPGTPDGGEEGEEGGGGEGLMCDPASDAGCSEEGEGGGVEDDLRSGWQCWADGGGMSGAVANCFQTAYQSLWGGLVSSSSLVSVANATAAAWPAGGGACPSGVVNIAWLNQSFDFWEVPCSFLDDVEAVLGPMFLLGWALMGLRILLTIPGGE